MHPECLGDARPEPLRLNEKPHQGADVAGARAVSESTERFGHGFSRPNFEGHQLQLLTQDGVTLYEFARYPCKSRIDSDPRLDADHHHVESIRQRVVDRLLSASKELPEHPARNDVTKARRGAEGQCHLRLVQ